MALTDHLGEVPTALAPDVDLPETVSYRLKRVLLGPPLTTEELPNERLSNGVALGVLAPDCISSSAYGSEEMLRILIPVVGVAAFSLLIPVTLSILFVLLLVTLSYREVVQVYTRAGGSYVVARENFGPGVAQIAAVALLIDYTVTVAVQTAAGTDALVSAVPRLTPYILPITLVSVVLLCYGNLRGIREAGRFFAFPTYFFIFSIGLVVVVGLVRALLGHLHVQPIPHDSAVLGFGHPGHGLLLGASLFIVLRAFANGGSSLTGLEAISNGVSAFRAPEGRNARRVLVIMSTTLGVLVLGVSILARLTHAVPYISGAPTVISQEAKYVFGAGAVPHVLYLLVQLATMLVLFTGANTSFNGFPFLASFVAEDSFLPRQLTHRGHRLTFSNGILVLALVSFLLLLATGAKVDALVGIYAIGVFTGFTMAGAGMVRFHVRTREAGWRHKLVINGSASVLSFSVVMIFAITKFTQGAWLVVVFGPLLVFALLRLNRRYRAEVAALTAVTPFVGRIPQFQRTVVLVLVDSLDLATLRALRYARSLKPTEMRAVHFMLDSAHAAALQAQWGTLPNLDLPLDVVDCPDRRLARAAVKLTTTAAAEEGTQVTVLLPRRTYSPLLGRLLHDRTADRIAGAVSKVHNAAATIVPFDAATPFERQPGQTAAAGQVGTAAQPGQLGPAGPAGALRTRELAPGSAVSSIGRPATSAGPSFPAGVPAPLAAAGPAAGGPTAAGGSTAGGPRAGAPLASVPAGSEQPGTPTPSGTTPIGEVRWRQRARVQGQIRSVETRPMSGAPVLEATLADETGGLRLLFYGRRSVPGISPGARVWAEGMVGEFKGSLAISNPSYQLIGPESDDRDG